MYVLTFTVCSLCCAMRYFIEVNVPLVHSNILLYYICVNIITITINDLVQHILACMGYCQLTVKCNEVFGCLLKLKFQPLLMWCLYLACVACSVCVFLSMCFVCIFVSLLYQKLVFW